MGSMMAIPLGFLLFASFFDLDTLKWTIYGIIGLALVTYSMNKKSTKTIFFLNFLSLIFLLIPICNRLMLFSWDKFNFPLFYIPLLIFIICYLLSLIIECKHLKKSV
jgi:hypothetical protein